MTQETTAVIWKLGIAAVLLAPWLVVGLLVLTRKVRRSR